MTNCIFSVNFHVFPKRGRMGVGFVTASHFAVVGLVAGVHVRVLLAITRVRESSVAPVKLAFKRFLT